MNLVRAPVPKGPIAGINPQNRAGGTAGLKGFRTRIKAQGFGSLLGENKQPESLGFFVGSRRP